MNPVNLEGRCLITNYHYWFQENVISHAMCDLLLSEVDWSKKEDGGFMTGGVHWTNPDMRVTEVAFQTDLTALGCVMQTYMQMANAVCWGYNTSFVEPVQVGRYPEGGHYGWHVDVKKPDENGLCRKLSSVLLLSDDFDGGELEMKKETLPKLTKGSIIVFPSFLQHRVTPVTRNERYTAVAWAVGPYFR
jgi:PKHD-type hydroxylase